MRFDVTFMIHEDVQDSPTLSLPPVLKHRVATIVVLAATFYTVLRRVKSTGLAVLIVVHVLNL